MNISQSSSPHHRCLKLHQKNRAEVGEEVLIKHINKLIQRHQVKKRQNSNTSPPLETKMAEERTHGSSATAAGGGAPTVKSIFIYPIKSCKGISVSKAPLSPTGFVWDRHWMVISSKGRGSTQRVEPKLALIQVELPLEAFSFGWQPNNSSYLVVRAPGMAELKVSLTKPGLRSDGVSIWDWSGSALDEGDKAAKWFTDFLGKPSRLVRFNEESETRPTDPKYATGFNVKFPDAFPYLLISEPSLDAVNEQLKEPVSINRFRPNIYVSGCEPFAEDLWKQIKINGLTFQGVMLCPRCKVPTINQEDGTQGNEPTKTMMKFRSSKVLEVDTTTTQFKGRVYLGQMLVCEDKTNMGKIVSVGDIIEVEKVFPSYADVAV
ncbi:putative molybdenum cofactor sulfurtransferase [Helianthus debilis subsp. tardiflorus]